MPTFAEVILRQFEPTLEMLAGCIDECPESAWIAEDGNTPIWEHVFHAAVWLDTWMRTPDQEFHAPAFFSKAALDLEPGAQPVVSRAEMRAYVAQVAGKCRRLLSSADEELLLREVEIRGGRFTLADQAFCQMRHVQYHAGCVSALLQRRTGLTLPWAGFREG